MKQTRFFTLVCLLSIVLLWGSLPYAHGQTILYEKNLLSADADSSNPEDIFLALGKACRVEIITHGEEFSQKAVTIHFKNKPLKEGIKTLVKVCGVKNYIMDFKQDKAGDQKPAKLDLYMGGSGDYVLVRGADTPQEENSAKLTVATDIESANQMGQDSSREEIPSDKGSFAEGGNFKWDGSAPIAFPEYKGELDYAKSKNVWPNEAKEFSKNSMSILPPAIRGMMADAIIITSDEVAQERGAGTITPDITAEAIARLARSANMPPDVMKNIPKSMSDFNKPRVPISAENLKEQYR